MDKGIGIPDAFDLDFDLDKADSLGQKFRAGAQNQLRETVTSHNTNGTTFTIRFSLDEV